MGTAVALILFYMSLGFADTCPFEVVSSGNLQVQRMRYGERQQCVVMVSLLKREPSWRSYSFFESGLFMIFMNFGGGDHATQTGARTYYFFPRNQIPSFSFERDHLKVTDSSQHIHQFDLKTGNYISLSNAEVYAGEKILPENEGGFYIKTYEGLMLDNGFAFGELPYTTENNFSIFNIGSHGCSAKNKNLFEYIYASQPDGRRTIESIYFKLNDQEVRDFVNVHCGNMVQ